jgi:hypothetical protein
MKSHFEDEERLRGNILRKQRETSKFGERIRDKLIFVKSHFEDEERLRGNILRKQRETSKFGERIRDKLIFVKSHFEDEERLRKRRKNSGKIHIRKSQFV